MEATVIELYKNTGLFHTLECEFVKKLSKICENQLNCNNELPVIGKKNYALQKPFATDFRQ